MKKLLFMLMMAMAGSVFGATSSPGVYLLDNLKIKAIRTFFQCCGEEEGRDLLKSGFWLFYKGTDDESFSVYLLRGSQYWEVKPGFNLSTDSFPGNRSDLLFLGCTLVPQVDLDKYGALQILCNQGHWETIKSLERPPAWRWVLSFFKRYPEYKILYTLPDYDQSGSDYVDDLYFCHQDWSGFGDIRGSGEGFGGREVYSLRIDKGFDGEMMHSTSIVGKAPDKMWAWTRKMFTERELNGREECAAPERKRKAVEVLFKDLLDNSEAIFGKKNSRSRVLNQMKIYLDKEDKRLYYLEEFGMFFFYLSKSGDGERRFFHFNPRNFNKLGAVFRDTGEDELTRITFTDLEAYAGSRESGSQSGAGACAGK